MELSLSNTLLAGDPRLIDHIVGEVKSQGIFDQFRKECIADVDTKPAYQNLRTRVEGSVNSFLSKQTWKPDLNKNQFRETLRKHIHDAPYLDAGVERIVDQVVNPKVYSVFMPQIEDVVYKFLGIERPKVKEKNGACGLKDLLPKDLDPVSPESDKNSLKDLSLESLDTSENLNEKEDDKIFNEHKLQDQVLYTDKDNTDSENGHVSSEEKIFNEACKILSVASNINLNISGKSDDKIDEEEEDSPTFEPIDIMNLNESNMSNDSHLSGISELTSHRSKTPDFSNELSQDNFDCSNQDSQLSKVSSDSRVSIVTDFGSSNHGSAPIFDTSKVDETMRDKYDAKNNKDEFRAIKEFDSSRNKIAKNNFEFIKCKDTQGCKDLKDIKSTKSTSRENSHDVTDSSVKDKCEYKSLKEKFKDSESIKFKSTKEKISSKDAKHPKDKSNEKKKTSSNSNIKYDKHNKSKIKEKNYQMKDNFEKAKDNSENVKENANKLKDEKLKETDKKDNINKEAKDLKDLYKEKIRELREKKELTEKEKLNKDKLNKETKDRKDSSKDRKSSRKEHKHSSSSSSKNLSVDYHENKNRTLAEKMVNSKDKRIDIKDKVRREEKRLSKDSKSKTHFSNKIDLSDKFEKYDLKKTSRSEKEDKTIKTDVKKDVKVSGDKIDGKKNTKNYFQSKTSDRNDKLDNKKDSKNDSQPKDKKRREEKKPKMKDDHPSLRKNSNDRRSTDRDGSNGSNSKTSQSNNSYSNVTSQKSGSSSLTKENQVDNSNSETSDNIEEMQVNDMKLSHHSNYKLSHKSGLQSMSDKSHLKIETDDHEEVYDTQEEVDLHQTSFPSKKRHMYSDDDDKSTSNDIIKKPKFAKNIHEAKKLMKIRKQMEKQKTKENKTEKKIAQEMEQTGQSHTIRDDADNLAGMPDDERVQIIEIPDEEYDEPYPEKEFNLMLDERSIIMLGDEPCANDFLNSHYNKKATLSNMELCIRESLSEIVSNISLGTIVTQSNDLYRPTSTFSSAVSTTYTKDTENLLVFKEELKDDFKVYTNDKIQSKSAITWIEKSSDSPQIRETSISPSREKVTFLKESEFANKNARRLIEENTEVWDYHRKKIRYDYEEVVLNDCKTEIQDNEEAKSQSKKQVETFTQSKINTDLRSDCTGATSFVSEDNEDCLYFKTDNEKSEKFSNFLESLELVESSSLEDIIESLGGKVVSSVPKSIASTFPKPKRSSSPLLDILVNNSNNNNNGHKQTLSSSANEDVHNVKKRKLFMAKKSRLPSFCNTQGISNGENFVMPLSPDSDVSATSEKTVSSNAIKEEKRYISYVIANFFCT
ncbi:Protein FAM44A [Harpegnathos saltator]|uniref:Protein FAM44A n=1 Tax=Harpegnathos saltator TaxID=610380 RepID=E2BKY2_HARSA|nr:Protein FAM44A [Harpegnathos saltator]